MWCIDLPNLVFLLLTFEDCKLYVIDQLEVKSEYKGDIANISSTCWIMLERQGMTT